MVRKAKMPNGDIVSVDEYGYLHNDEGPALITRFGVEEWWVHGKRHRTDGPAILYPNGKGAYYIDNVELTETEFHKDIK